MKIFFSEYRFISFTLILSLFAIHLHANSDDQFINQVNLALRQTGHHLLLSQKDSTTTVPPIEYDGNYGFLLPLECVFNYDTLPTLLNRAFIDYGITESYDLMVKDCNTGISILGFNKASIERNDVACKGREQLASCANIFVQFSPKVNYRPEKTSNLSWLMILMISGLTIWLFNMLRTHFFVSKDSGNLPLGQYSFDPKNHVLIKGSEKINLTFRENKLLHLFASQPNKVLNRSDILSAVWEDEGVIVGRSLDVFISRLRKLLKQDPSVQIKNIHGVGYRLELP